ncbi:transmembrane ascorbate-dependent reductase CYB561 isoform X2 [Ischnura elegans]|nr:transmembrane ascorbate-dependent reductase CYB561 isoform X2 [Ischnura elegans]XP_046388336.1 transmembrane ascorbate-dependent reductase CYB561 isoform X2 [Ischnura elegans]XP_046388337.1 transmembrane ascorbate-dependent reductase CYB561 isoform X2 [Ischnura elegans]XP_046388338.1 transmembrane ascorbate-dependent reductase CYB561 isoform X2 [Ischnura elegans]
MYPAMDQDVNQNLEGFNVTLFLTETVGITAVLLMAIWISVYRGGYAWTSSPDLEFNWHPLLMTIGMIFMYGNGILVYRVFRGRRKRKLKIGHAFIHLMVFVLAVIALQAVFDSHNLKVPPTPNLYSLHSWIGLIAVILFSCQWVSGLVSFLYPGLHVSLRASYLPVHTFFGIGGFLSSVTAALLGLLEKAHFSVQVYQDLPTEGLLVNFIGMAIVLFTVLVMFLVTTPRFRRLATTEDDLLLQEDSQHKMLLPHHWD